MGSRVRSRAGYVITRYQDSSRTSQGGRGVPGQAMIRDEALGLGQFRRAPDRWHTEFGRWVSDFGTSRIVAALAHDPDLRVTNQSVYEWLQGHPPTASRALALVAMSRGRRTLDAIYHHALEIRRPPDTTAASRRSSPSAA